MDVRLDDPSIDSRYPEISSRLWDGLSITNVNSPIIEICFAILKFSCTLIGDMEQLRNESPDRTARTDAPDPGFYLPGMPGPSLEHSRVVRSLRRLFRRRGVLPADLLLRR